MPFLPLFFQASCKPPRWAVPSWRNATRRASGTIRAARRPPRSANARKYYGKCPADFKFGDPFPLAITIVFCNPNCSLLLCLSHTIGPPCVCARHADHHRSTDHSHTHALRQDNRPPVVTCLWNVASRLSDTIEGCECNLELHADRPLGMCSAVVILRCHLTLSDWGSRGTYTCSLPLVASDLWT